MNEELSQEMLAEILESMSFALGIVSAAVAQQIDATKFHSDLKRQLDAAKQLPSTPGLAVHLANHALAAVAAEKALQKQAKR